MNRRQFLKGLFASAALSAVPFTVGEAISDVATKQTFYGITADDLTAYIAQMECSTFPDEIVMSYSQYKKYEAMWDTPVEKDYGCAEDLS